MGGPLWADGDISTAFTVWSNRPLTDLVQQTVWVIVGEGDTPRQYRLGSLFLVGEAGDCTEGDFKHFASGHGYAFDPAPLLNQEEWFADLRRAMANFVTVREVRDRRFVRGLQAAAERAVASAAG